MNTKKGAKLNKLEQHSVLPSDTPTANYRGKKATINGTRVWMKGHSPCTGGDDLSPYHERAAYLIDEMLGLGIVPPTILYLDNNGELTSAMKWVRGKHNYTTDTEAKETEYNKMKLFDYLIDNNDRHGGNWIIRPSGKIWAIDNAMTFGTWIDKYPKYEVPLSIIKRMRQLVENKKYVYSQLLGLLEKSQINAFMDRMKILVKKSEKSKTKPRTKAKPYTYKAVLFSLDGNWTVDCKGKTKDEVIDKLANRGSRWYFYPIEGIIIDKGHLTKPTQRVLSLAPNLPKELHGKSIKTICKWLANQSDEYMHCIMEGGL